MTSAEEIRLAKRHVRVGERHIRRQHKIIARLEAEGSPAGDAIRFLDLLEKTQRQYLDRGDTLRQAVQASTL